MATETFIDLPSDQQPSAVLKGKVCPYCGGKTTLIDSIEVYKSRSYGMIYACKPCLAWVGLHSGATNKGEALGRVAKKALRDWKIRVHEILDRFWKHSQSSEKRRNLYKRLAAEMGLKNSRCHVGMFNVDQCKRAIEILQTWR